MTEIFSSYGYIAVWLPTSRSSYVPRMTGEHDLASFIMLLRHLDHADGNLTIRS